MVCDVYGDTFDDVALVAAGSGVSGLIEDDDDWNLGEISLSRNANVRASLDVEFRTIQTQCHKLNHAVPDKDADGFG